MAGGAVMLTAHVDRYVALRRTLGFKLHEHLVLDGDLTRSNTAEAEWVSPRRMKGAELPPRSWNVLRWR